MVDEIEIRLDDRVVRARRGETLWQLVCRHGVVIPHLCLSTEPDFRPDGNCRLCMVEVEGRAALAASCITHPEAGMRVRVDSPRARAARRSVMALLLAEAAVAPDSACARLAAEMGVDGGRFPPAAPAPAARDESHAGIAVDLGACIRCLRCVQACREVELHDVIGMAARGARSTVVFDTAAPMGQSTCVSCGSCAQTCPTGALAFRVPA